MAEMTEEGEIKPDLPQIDWNQASSSFSSVDEGSLPQVVKFKARGGPGAAPLLPGLALYADQPVLLYARTRKAHARARTIYHDRDGPYFEVGQTLDIPDDFDGW